MIERTKRPRRIEDRMDIKNACFIGEQRHTECVYDNRRTRYDRRGQVTAEQLAEFRYNRWFRGLTTYDDSEPDFNKRDDDFKFSIIDEAEQDLKFIRGEK